MVEKFETIYLQQADTLSKALVKNGMTQVIVI